MKKNLILAIACVLAVQISMAQTQKGAQTLGGYINYTQNNSNSNSLNSYSGQTTFQKTTNSNFSIGPVYSIFLADKLELGGSVRFSRTKYESIYTGSFPSNNFKQIDNSFGGSLSLLKYYMYDKIGLRMGPYIGYTRGTSKATPSGASVTSTTNTDNYNAGAKADLVYYPSKSLGFAASLVNLGYTKSKSHNTDFPQQNSSSEVFNFNFITNAIGLSVFYIFGGK